MNLKPLSARFGHEATLGAARLLPEIQRDRPRIDSHCWRGRCRTDRARGLSQALQRAATMQIVTETPSRGLI